MAAGSGSQSLWKFRPFDFFRSDQWYGIAAGRLYLSLRGPSAKPLFSERNRYGCVVLPLRAGWRIVLSKRMGRTIG